ncbi:MAG: energy transducer TonB [bacterium]|nr:energy transducer TonB [bacterium]
MRPMERRRPNTCRTHLVTALLLLAVLASCAPPPPPATAPVPVPCPASGLAEVPAPNEGWRGHVLARCVPEPGVPAEVERLLGLCSNYFREGSGSDGMTELELALERGERHPLVLMALGQLYVMAGQGEPALLPNEGPAADTGNWESNRLRLLARAGALLEEAGRSRPDDAAVDYLLADAARAGRAFGRADELADRGRGKCTGGRGFALLQLYQQLHRYPAKLTACGSPDYPRSALARRITGVVTIDLLLDPDGAPRQTVAVASPDAALTAAAEKVFRAASYDPARLGKYPVWAWLRVSTTFRLTEAD